MNTKFFPPYRLLREFSILKAGPALFNRDRDWCSCFIMPKEKIQQYYFGNLPDKYSQQQKPMGCNKM